MPPTPQPLPQPQPAPQAAPRVLVIRDHRVVREVRVTRALNIGRLPDNDLVIDDEQVSGHHGRIERVGPGWRYTDLGSTNGSIVASGPTLRAHQSVPLEEDLQILLGATVLDVRVQDPRRAGERPAASGPALRPRVVVAAGEQRTLHELPEAGGVLGRGAGATVSVEHPSVSQRHCEIRRAGAGFEVADLSSTNGTRLGLRRLDAPAPLPSGSHLILGEADLLFVHDVPSPPDAQAALDALRGRGRVTRAQEASVRRELSRGRTAGEALVLAGVLSPGEWVEVAAGRQTTLVEPRSRRGPLRVAVLVAVLAGLLGVLAWVLAG